jgi:hypothetical protein
LAKTGVSEQVEPRVQYPRVIASQGDAPPQYPDFEEDEDEA